MSQRIDPDSAREADERLYRGHPGDPNLFNRDGTRRPLVAGSSEHATYRQEWLVHYRDVSSRQTELIFNVDTGVLSVATGGGDTFSMSATSGNGASMNRNSDDGRSDQGPIPQGTYSIDTAEISDPSLAGDILRRIAGDWGDWRTPLHPDSSTDTKGRSGFFLHGGGKEGSKGCIDVGGGILGDENTERLLKALQNDPDRKVRVKVTKNCTERCQLEAKTKGGKKAKSKKTKKKSRRRAAALSPEYKAKIRSVATNLGIKPEHLAAVIDLETAGTFDPAVRNPGSSATGLIQFMDKTARGLGTTTDQLAQMSAVDQLDYVEKYLAPYKGRMSSLGDVYAAVFTPSAVGRSSAHTIYSAGSEQYRLNAGLDVDRDGRITAGDLAQSAGSHLERGRSLLNAEEYDEALDANRDGRITEGERESR